MLVVLAGISSLGLLAGYFVRRDNLDSILNSNYDQQLEGSPKPYANLYEETSTCCALLPTLLHCPHFSYNLSLYGESSSYFGLRISSMQAIKVDQQGIQTVCIMVRPG